MRKELTIAILTIGMTLGMASMATASGEDGEVNVTVSSTTQVDVRPTELSYSGLQPGDEATSAEEANGYVAVEVENIGSNALSTVYAETSQPTANPFGTGDVTNYDSGNFVTLSTETARSTTYENESWYSSVASGNSQDPHYTNRVEFTDTPVPTYIETASDDTQVGIDTTGDLSNNVGRFREGNQWYFYVVYYDDDGQYCDGSNPSELWVGTDAHTPSTLGTTDFTDSSASDIETYSISSADGNTGVADSSIELDTDLVYPDVYTYCDDNNEEDGHTVRSRFNIEPTIDATSTTIDQANSGTTPIFTESDADSRLEPGAYFPVDVTVKLPQGVVADDITEGRLTLLAEEAQ